MSKVEIILIISISVVPFVTLFFVWPKYKSKQAPKETKTLEQYNIEETGTKVKSTEEKVENKKTDEKSQEEAYQEFKEFLSRRKQKCGSIVAKENPKTETFSYQNNIFDTMPSVKKRTKNKSIDEEIENLSPSLMALIISGMLDKKDF